MKRLTSLVFISLFALTAVASAQSTESGLLRIQSADMEDLTEFKWKNRPVLVFADSPDDSAFVEQMELIRARMDALAERDVVVLTDTDPAARSAMRLKMRPRGFMLVLVGKDGGVKLRKPFPWDMREITRSIDKMPIRQREIRESKERAG